MQDIFNLFPFYYLCQITQTYGKEKADKDGMPP